MIEREIDRKGDTIDRSSLSAEKKHMVRMNVVFLCWDSGKVYEENGKGKEGM